MALLESLSLKWKISLAMIMTGFVLISVYAFIASDIFKADKISYVYDAQNSSLMSAKEEIQGRIERIMLAGRTAIANYDFSQGKLSKTGEQFFAAEHSILGIELWSESKSQAMVHLQKPSFQWPEIDSGKGIDQKIGEIYLTSLGEDLCRMSMRYKVEGRGEFILSVLLPTTELLPRQSSMRSFALAFGEDILGISDLRGIDKSIFQEIANWNPNGFEMTKTFVNQKERFLVTVIPLAIPNLKIFAMTPEAEVLGMLDDLLRKSIIFILLSTFGLIAVSLTLVRGMTRDLGALTKQAHQIGEGNFQSALPVRSKDEVGILVDAFSKMADEIQRLLLETREKTRMEEDLKIGKYVQEQLMPEHPTKKFGQIDINGLVISSNECGGDWWYYFARGDELYIAIADATGHGSGAGFITAAARSIFSKIENENLSLNEMMRMWDRAVSSCSKKKVFMTGQLFKINTQTGRGAFINAAHEAPLILRFNKENESYVCEPLVTNPSLRIGDGVTELPETEFQLQRKDSLLLYTDGLFAVEKDGKTLSERKFMKHLEKNGHENKSAMDLTSSALLAFENHRQGLPLPDDISLVAICNC